MKIYIECYINLFIEIGLSQIQLKTDLIHNTSIEIIN